MKQTVKKWYAKVENSHPVVLASRVWIVRNCVDYDFSCKITPEDSQELVRRLKSLKRDISLREGREFYSCNFNELGKDDKNELLSVRLVTGPFTQKKLPTGLLLADDESVCITGNDFDHIRIHADSTGLSLGKCLECAQRVEETIAQEFTYVHSDKYGFLSSDPMSAGQGVICEVIMMLPAIMATGHINDLKATYESENLHIETMFAFKEEVPLYCVRYKNRRARNYREIVEELEEYVRKIIGHELCERARWLSQKKAWLADRISRSYGVLKFSKTIEFREAIVLLIQIKLGIDTKLVGFRGIEPNILEMIFESTASLLKKSSDKETEDEPTSVTRASYIRRKFSVFNEL